VSFAPVANNVIVTVTMVAFVIMRRGHAGGGLDLTMTQKLVVGAGTTLGVLAMTLVPWLAMRRTGAHLRPGPVDRSSPLLRDVARVGLWSGAFLAANQLLVAVTLVLANRVEGGVIAYQIAFTFFLLPVAVFAHPIFTALYPRLAGAVHAGRWELFGADVAGGVRLTVFLVLPAAALLGALGEPLLRVLRLGAIDTAGATLVGRVVAAYAVGLAGYAVLLFLVRAATASGQVRAAAAVGAGVLTSGALFMVAMAAAASGDGRVVVLGLAHSLAVTLGAVTLYELVRRRSGMEGRVLPTVARSAAIAAGGGAVAWGVAHAVSSGTSRSGAAAALVLGGLAGLIVIVAAHWMLRSPELETLRTPDFGFEPVSESS
jgi:putative peptidoglycan lipid II flippase